MKHTNHIGDKYYYLATDVLCMCPELKYISHNTCDIYMIAGHIEKNILIA